MGKQLNKVIGQVAGRSSGEALELDPAFCWQAVYSRDRRFDGRFFAGMTTTGIYCRPICPVSFGTPNNVRWFHSAAAAESARFRPCKRCRPDTSPGSSAWFGTWAVVSHAVKLISQGALNEGNVEQLADRLGIGSRHLRRLFNRHLGASPLKVARSHRVQIARNLIVETNLLPTQIASCASFSSIRQFNHSVKTTFGRSPSELRRLRKTSEAGDRQTGVIVHLPYRTPFDWVQLIRFLAQRASPGVEAVEDGFYRRTIEIDGAVGSIEVWEEPHHERLAMRVRLPRYDCLMQVVQRVSRLLDLGADALHIKHVLGRDRKLAGMVAERPGLRVPGVWDGFELAVRTLLGQRLTIVDAPTIVDRLVQTFGRRIDVRIPGLTHLFPQPEILMQANFAVLDIPVQRAEAITCLARAVAARKITFDGYNGSDSILAELRRLPNIDESDISYIAMRILAEPDVAPHMERGLRRALDPPGRVVSPAYMLRTFEKFRPWRAYAAMHLWAASEQTEKCVGRPRKRSAGNGSSVSIWRNAAGSRRVPK